jgi:SAM-dependent methyltransferase
MDTPTPWLLRWLPQISGSALDLACGAGRHSRAMQQAGLQVTAVDIAPGALPTEVECITADLEQGPWPLAGRVFDLVLVTNYLWRPRWPALLACVGDWYLHETFAAGQERLGRPRSPDFLLQPGELFRVCTEAGLRVLAFEDGLVNGARVQRIAARRAPDALLESFIP